MHEGSPHRKVVPPAQKKSSFKSLLSFDIGHIEGAAAFPVYFSRGDGALPEKAKGDGGRERTERSGR